MSRNEKENSIFFSFLFSRIFALRVHPPSFSVYVFFFSSLLENNIVIFNFKTRREIDYYTVFLVHSGLGTFLFVIRQTRLVRTKLPSFKVMSNQLKWSRKKKNEENVYQAVYETRVKRSKFFHYCTFFFSHQKELKRKLNTNNSRT